MSNDVRIDSIDSLRAFRVAIWKFIESAQAALGDAESDVNKTLVWLSGEQETFWAHQIRLRTEAVNKAREKVRDKRLYKDASGRVQSAADEEKALKAALRRLEEAEQKLAATRKWARKIQHEIHNYKGGVQRLATMLSTDLPTAAARLEKLSIALGKYVAAGPSVATSTAGREIPAQTADAAEGESMSRAEPGAAEVASHALPPGFPELSESQVALVRLDAATGVPELQNDEAAGSFYRVFDSMEEAISRIQALEAENPAVRCELYDSRRHRIDDTAA
jgi:hypothetical protein